MYVNELQKGQCDPNTQPVIVKETPGTAFVDGQNGIGMASAYNYHLQSIKNYKKEGIRSYVPFM